MHKARYTITRTKRVGPTLTAKRDEDMGAMVYTLTIADAQVASVKLHPFDRMAINEPAGSVSDVLVSLEVLVRKIEEGDAKWIMQRSRNPSSRR